MLTKLEATATAAKTDFIRLGLIGSQNAEDLAHALRSNHSALQSAIASYDRAATTANQINERNADAQAHHFAVFAGVDEHQFADVGGDTPVTTTDVATAAPEPAAAVPPAGPAQQRARLGAAADIARINAQADALAQEAQDILASGPPASQTPAEPDEPSRVSHEQPLHQYAGE